MADTEPFRQASERRARIEAELNATTRDLHASNAGASMAACGIANGALGAEDDHARAAPQAAALGRMSNALANALRIAMELERSHEAELVKQGVPFEQIHGPRTTEGA
jgi:hypothetical protein